MKKITIISTLMFLSLAVFFAETLNLPKNSQLYTEFKSVKTAKFLKKPLASSGYIVMNGKNNFLYKQTEPFSLEVRKKGLKIILKKDKMDPIEIPSTANGDNIAFLFEGDEAVMSNYNISKKAVSEKDFYTITPKQTGKIKEISIVGKDDKYESIKLLFTDNSTITYDFKNTTTGTPPDEKYFQ